MLHHSRWLAAAVAALLGFAAPAQAAHYQYSSGTATITASGPTGIIGSAPFALSGAFADFDTDTGLLTDFHFTTAPDQWLVLNTPLGGYDQIWVNSASVMPGPGFATTQTTLNSPGHWNIQVNPLAIDATFTAKNSVTLATLGPVTLPTIVSPYDLNATIDANADSFTLQGITIGAFTVSGTPIVVGAVITFHGATPVPEPAAFGLLALAGLALASARSRARCA